MKINLSLTWPLLVLTFALLIPAEAVAYYDPGEQRWINRDPAGKEGGLNLYCFAQNAPVSSVDPFGDVSLNVCACTAVGCKARCLCMDVVTGDYFPVTAELNWWQCALWIVAGTCRPIIIPVPSA